MSINFLAQLGITLFGGTAIFLVGRRASRVRRWGFICGLLAQPCWYHQMIAHQQWAMLPVFAFYTYSWITGFWNHWVAPAANDRA